MKRITAIFNCIALREHSEVSGSFVHERTLVRPCNYANLYLRVCIQAARFPSIPNSRKPGSRLLTWS